MPFARKVVGRDDYPACHHDDLLAFDGLFLKLCGYTHNFWSSYHSTFKHSGITSQSNCPTRCFHQSIVLLVSLVKCHSGELVAGFVCNEVSSLEFCFHFWVFFSQNRQCLICVQKAILSSMCDLGQTSRASSVPRTPGTIASFHRIVT